MDDGEYRTETGAGAAPLSVFDELSERQIRALGDPHARATLRYLEEDRTTTLADLADVVTGSEAAATGSISGPSRRRTNLVRLHHQTLPRLADCGFVEYDADDSTVTTADIPDAVSTLLEQAD